jgi:hypothetical protein
VLVSDPFNSRAGQAGLPVLRLLRTLTATCKATTDEVSHSSKTTLKKDRRFTASESELSFSRLKPCRP